MDSIKQDADRLFEKLASGVSLSATEVTLCMQTLDERLTVLKKEDPERYISLVEELASLYESLGV
jgi:hypothetical protein